LLQDPSTLDITPQPISEHAPNVLIIHLRRIVFYTTMASETYPDPYIIPPSTTHTTTLILLHGTSTSGPELASTLLAFPIPSPTSPQTSTLQQLLPSTKLVFPTGRLRPTTVFGGRESHAWFDIHDFSDRTVGEEVQSEGIGESIEYLAELVKQEVGILGDGKRVVVGGFSQGAAMAGMLILSGFVPEIQNWVVLSGWLPFRLQLERSFSLISIDMDASVNYIYAARRSAVARSLRGITGLGTGDGNKGEMRVWMGHGRDDEKVRLEWGGQMRDVIRNLGVRAEWNTYEGLGHWFEGTKLKDLVGWLEGIWVRFL
jgi:predicted esterase